MALLVVQPGAYLKQAPTGGPFAAARRASPYTPREGGGWRISAPHNDSTSLLTTIVDLLKWEQNLLDARVGGPELIARKGS